MSKACENVLNIIKNETKKNSYSTYSLGEIAKKTNISYRHAIRVVKKLFEYGCINKLDRPGKENFYMATGLEIPKLRKKFRNFKPTTNEKEIWI